jgi:REP element-mobilizing transposase RayT
MPRANQYYIPGYVWHITHRCHKKEFLLKYAQGPKAMAAMNFRGLQ